jgi:hypothetical protein
MRSLRKKMLRERILYLKAQVDLAKQNMIQFEKRTKDQQEVLAEIDGMQDEEKEALNALQTKWDQMQEDQRIKEEYWRSFWQSGLLLKAPFTRQNLLRRDWFGDRQHEGRYVLDKKEQEKLNQELIRKRAQLEKIAADSYEEEITLKNLQEDFTHHFQFLKLSGILNNELARLQRMNREDKACHPC